MVFKKNPNILYYHYDTEILQYNSIQSAEVSIESIIYHCNMNKSILYIYFDFVLYDKYEYQISFALAQKFLAQFYKLNFKENTRNTLTMYILHAFIDYIHIVIFLVPLHSCIYIINIYFKLLFAVRFQSNVFVYL